MLGVLLRILLAFGCNLAHFARLPSAGVILEVARKECGGQSYLDEALDAGRVIEEGGLYYFKTEPFSMLLILFLSHWAGPR